MDNKAERLSILMAVPQYPYPVVGGLEKQAHELAVELVAQGHRVFALSGRITPEQLDCANVNGVEVHRFPWPRHRITRWFTSPWSLWRHFHGLARRVDVVHVHVFSGFGLFLILLASVYRKPVLMKLPNVRTDGVPGLARGILGPLRILVFARADAVVAMSRESHAELQAIGYDQRRVLTTPNGIRLPSEEIAPGKDGAAAVRFVFAGRLHEQKGIFDMLTAAKQLLADARVAAFSIDLLGEGPQRAAIEQDIRASGLSAHVRLWDHVDDVRAMLSNHDVFVLPSYREGNSNAILEAMAAGLPIISTRVGGTAMLVGSAGAMMLHEPGDVAALTRLMAQMIADADLRTEVGMAMRERVHQHFDIRRVADTYAAAYHLLATGRRREVASVSNPVITEGRE